MTHIYKRTFLLSIPPLLAGLAFIAAGFMHFLNGSVIGLVWLLGSIIWAYIFKWNFTTPLVSITDRFLNYQPSRRKHITILIKDITKVEIIGTKRVDVYHKNDQKVKIGLFWMESDMKEDFKRVIMEFTKKSQATEEE